jgi:hypothetical protein
MDNIFLPRSIDNNYRGQKPALWFFWVVIIIRGTQGLALIFNGHSIVRAADGVPLETFPIAASQSIVAMFVVSGASRLVLSLFGLVAFIRYKSAIPLIFAVQALDQICKEILFQIYPLYRVGNPVGPIVNLIVLLFTLIGFILSISAKRIVKR